jgi:hypothetical protein
MKSIYFVILTVLAASIITFYAVKIWHSKKKT